VLALDVVQAAFGDALVLRFGSARQPRCILIDGGPSVSYAGSLRPELAAMAAAGERFDAVVLSHIDNDHVEGLLAYLAELRSADGEPSDLPSIGELWHNTFSLSAGGADIAPRIREVLAGLEEGAAAESAPADSTGFAGPAHAPGTAMRTLTGILMGVGEGDALRAAAVALGIPINPRWPERLVLLDRSPAIRMGGVSIRVVGPSRAILDRLRTQWLAWLAKHARVADAPRGAASMAAAASADSSVPNLSSIVLLVRGQGASLLLTGDGRGDHILDGLAEEDVLDPAGGLHVSLLKVPHHGSSRNASEEFFRRVTADRYVISANGRHDNPDLPCLIWIVDTAREAGRPIELFMTNETPATTRLLKERPPDKWGYIVTTMPPDQQTMRISLA
jgi:hypothetical protein